MPEDDIFDSASQAWNDAITTSQDEDNSNNSADTFTLLVIHPQLLQPQYTEYSMMISIDLHSHRVRFGLSAQGDVVLSLLLTDLVPRQQLNEFIFTAIIVLIADVGPWLNVYGFKHYFLRVGFQVSFGAEGLIFSQTNSAVLVVTTESTVVIEELPR